MKDMAIKEKFICLKWSLLTHKILPFSNSYLADRVYCSPIRLTEELDCMYKYMCINNEFQSYPIQIYNFFKEIKR
jgi:hypothetical protein